MSARKHDGAELSALRDQGLTWEAIGKRYGISKSSAQTKVKRWRIQQPPPETVEPWTPPKTAASKAPRASGRKVPGETAVLVMSDIHYGKATATFNPTVCAQRLGRMGEKVALIRDILAGSYNFDRLAVFLLGDVNDGTGIYAGQEHYQAVTNVEAQAWEVAGLLGDWTRRQLDTWGAVDYYAVPGNHGRAGKFAHLAASWDIVAYRYLSAARLPGMSLTMSDDNPFLQTVDVRGHRYLLHHGHMIRAYMGIPWYGIARRLMHWATTERLAGFDVATFGHFHQLGDWHINRLRFLSTGTLVTDDDWALEALGAESPPAWWLFGAGDDHPVTWQYALDLT